MYPDPRAPQYPVIAVSPPTSGLAVASLILGIVSIGGGACLAVPPFLAVLLGHMATRETRSGRRGGHGMAVAGLILGYVGVAAWVLLALQFGAGLLASGDW